MTPRILALAAAFLSAATFFPAAGLAGEDVTYQVDGEAFEGYRAPAKGGEAKGLVLVVQDWDGLTGYEKKRADMLSELGYDAFALDLYGKGNRPEDTGAKKAEMQGLYEDRARMRKLLLAGLSEARKGSDKESVVVMGYCFGGAAALELAASGEAEDVAGYATFHGGLNNLHDQSYPEETPPILVAHGALDSSVSMKDVARLSEALEKSDVPYEIDIYSGAPHGFTVFGSDAYQTRADEKSWDAFTGFLEEQL
ncbi:dienelactone hydrolase family protein [Methyloligella solikamskensis]|uniref:Dienelactone hydrolase family protein n=1 Tax=Methyloligella solikamskensis TaxID=1177756 RepID=A0ABW3JDD9_9HYPH